MIFTTSGSWWVEIPYLNPSHANLLRPTGHAWFGSTSHLPRPFIWRIGHRTGDRDGQLGGQSLYPSLGLSRRRRSVWHSSQRVQGAEMGGHSGPAGSDDRVWRHYLDGRCGRTLDENF